MNFFKKRKKISFFPPASQLAFHNLKKSKATKHNLGAEGKPRLRKRLWTRLLGKITCSKQNSAILEEEEKEAAKSTSDTFRTFRATLRLVNT